MSVRLSVSPSVCRHLGLIAFQDVQDAAEAQKWQEVEDEALVTAIAYNDYYEEMKNVGSAQKYSN